MVIVPGINFANAIYVTWVKKLQSRKVHKMAGNAYVTFSRYHRLVEQTSQRELQLSSMIESEEAKHSELIEENKRLSTQISENSVNNATNIKLSRSEALNGNWRGKRIKRLSARINNPKPELIEDEIDIAIENNAIVNLTTNEKIAVINGYLFAPHATQVGVQFKLLEGKYFLNIKNDEWHVFVPEIRDQDIQKLSHAFIQSFELERIK